MITFLFELVIRELAFWRRPCIQKYWKNIDLSRELKKHTHVYIYIYISRAIVQVQISWNELSGSGSIKLIRVYIYTYMRSSCIITDRTCFLPFNRSFIMAVSSLKNTHLSNSNSYFVAILVNHLSSITSCNLSRSPINANGTRYIFLVSLSNVYATLCLPFCLQFQFSLLSTYHGRLSKRLRGVLRVLIVKFMGTERKTLVALAC